MDQCKMAHIIHHTFYIKVTVLDLVVSDSNKLILKGKRSLSYQITSTYDESTSGSVKTRQQKKQRLGQAALVRTRSPICRIGAGVGNAGG